MPETCEIVILGGNLGGTSIAHYLLKHTIPLLERRDKTVSYHITLVTPNTHLFFKVAAPRAFINSTLIPQEKIWLPLKDGFKKYNAEKFTILQGVAKDLDVSSKTVVVSPTSEGATTQKLQYHSLFISTGTTSASPLWTLYPDQSLTKKAFSSFHEKLPKAKTILISGGGTVGVESAGEIASEFKNAKITLISGGTRVLPRILPATSVRAQTYLEKIHGVEVIHNVRAVSNTAGTDGSSTVVTLSDGTTKTVDLYIDATGGVPNTQFLPPSWLDESQRVITMDNYFRVRGSSEESADARDVYVLGDIVAGSDGTLMQLDFMIPVAASSLAVDIAGGGKAPGILGGLKQMIFSKGNDLPVQKEFKPMTATLMVPIGREGGVGQILGWQAPSFLVKLVKGNSYLLPMFEPILSGSKW